MTVFIFAGFKPCYGWPWGVAIASTLFHLLSILPLALTKPNEPDDGLKHSLAPKKSDATQSDTTSVTEAEIGQEGDQQTWNQRGCFWYPSFIWLFHTQDPETDMAPWIFGVEFLLLLKLCFREYCFETQGRPIFHLHSLKLCCVCLVDTAATSSWITPNKSESPLIKLNHPWNWITP